MARKILRGPTRPRTKEPGDGVLVRIDIPPDFHPAVLAGDSPGSVTGRSALKELYEVAGRITDTARQVDDKARLAQAATPIAERALASADRGRATLVQQIAHLDSVISDAVTPPVEPQIASEIRGHWQRNGSDALTGIKKAIESGDKTTMASVLSSPAYLSGLSDANLTLLRVVAAEHVVPEKVRDRDAAADAERVVSRAIDHFTTTLAANLREWRDEDSKIIQEGLSS